MRIVSIMSIAPRIVIVASRTICETVSFDSPLNSADINFLSLSSICTRQRSSDSKLMSNSLPVTVIHLPIYVVAKASACTDVLPSYKPIKYDGLTFTKTFLGSWAGAGVETAAGAGATEWVRAMGSLCSKEREVLPPRFGSRIDAVIPSINTTNHATGFVAT
jgi:hypothetical protein